MSSRFNNVGWPLAPASGTTTALFRTVKGVIRQHLDETERRAVEGAITANSQRRTARGDDGPRVLDVLGNVLDFRWKRKLWNRR